MDYAILKIFLGLIQCLIEQGDFEHASEQVKAYKQLETEFSPVSTFHYF